MGIRNTIMQMSLNTQDLSAIRLPAECITYPQTCSRDVIQNREQVTFKLTIFLPYGCLQIVSHILRHVLEMLRKTGSELHSNLPWSMRVFERVKRPCMAVMCSGALPSSLWTFMSAPILMRTSRHSTLCVDAAAICSGVCKHVPVRP
jgi:hypothetical protein